MIGETIEQRRSTRNGLFFLLVAAALACGNFALEHHHLLILSLAPAGIGIAILAAQRHKLRIRFDDDGLTVLAPWTEFIHYDHIEALCCDERKRRVEPHSFSFEVTHRQGALSFPADLDVSSKAVYRFLKMQLADEEVIGPPPALRRYAEHFEREYGSDQVRGYRAMPDAKPTKGAAKLPLFSAAAAIGIIWLVIGLAVGGEYEGWGPAGGFFAILCVPTAIFWGVMRLQDPPSGNAFDGGIVITPTGYALQQRRFLGQMRWDEVTDIVYRYGSGRVRIVFDGGEIKLRDDYDRKLRSIYHRLLDYWEEPYRRGN
jgi:hypothetical protein